MADDLRRIAWSISKAARLMPAAERRAFRKFLLGLDGAEPAPRKIHSWKRKSNAKRAARPKRARSRRTKVDRQIPLPL